MIIEEAGETVLKGDPWVMCAVCQGSGWTHELVPADETTKDEPKTKRVECWCCHAAGFFLPPEVETAYQLIGAEIPPKPLTSSERMAKVTADFIKKRLDQPSVTRRLFPAVKVEKS